MAARHRPSDDDRVKAIDIALSGLVRDDELRDVAARLELLHSRNDTFPAEVLLELAADAIAICAVDPGLLDEVQWWRSDDLWYWSLEALAASCVPPPIAPASRSNPCANGSPINAA